VNPRRTKGESEAERITQNAGYGRQRNRRRTRIAENDWRTKSNHVREIAVTPADSNAIVDAG